MTSSLGVEDVPELLQHIQLWLPVKEAARTSILSKSWLHAWTTIPTLRFRIGRRKDMKLVDMERTLIRYLHADNMPIERFDLDIDIDDQESASLAEKSIRNTVETKTCTLKELSLSFHLYEAPLNLPYEILYCENLTKMRVVSTWGAQFSSLYHPVTINCVALRELYLECVNISQEVLDGILSSCRLLVKVEFINCSQGLNTIKIKNLPCLDELKIVTQDGGSTALEVNHVPNLRLFTWNIDVHRGQNHRVPFNAHAISIGSSMAQLSLRGVVTDNESLDMIKSGVPFLESLTLDMRSWNLESFHFTCASIKRLSLHFCQSSLIDVKVHAPNLLFFGLDGNTMPSLLLPISTLIKQTRFSLKLMLPLDVSFFLRTREALALSSNCYVHITLKHGALNPRPPRWDMDMDDLRARLPFPSAMNVQQLSFETWWNNECQWEHSLFFDAFFEICHPIHVTAKRDLCLVPKNYFCNMMLREVLEKKKITIGCWHRYLKHVKLRRHKKWETLKKSHRSFLDGPTPVHVYFYLKWL